MLTPTQLDVLDEFSNFNKSEFPVTCSLLAMLLKEYQELQKENEELKEDLSYWRYHDSKE